LRTPQNSREIGAMGEMAKVAFARGQFGVWLFYGRAMLFMTLVAKIGDGRAQQFRIGAGVRFVAIGAIAIGKGLMRLSKRDIGIRNILPMTLATHRDHIAP